MYGIQLMYYISASSHGVGVAATHSTLHFNGLRTVRDNSAHSGGGFYIDDSTIGMAGKNCFMNNTATSEGGAIYFGDCQVELRGKNMFVANTAGNKGAGIHTPLTTLILQGNSCFVNNSANYGGGIQSEGSNLTFVSQETSHYMNFTSTVQPAMRSQTLHFSLTAVSSTTQLTEVEHFTWTNTQISALI